VTPPLHLRGRQPHYRRAACNRRREVDAEPHVAEQLPQLVPGGVDLGPARPRLAVGGQL